MFSPKYNAVRHEATHEVDNLRYMRGRYVIGADRAFNNESFEMRRRV